MFADPVISKTRIIYCGVVIFCHGSCPRRRRVACGEEMRMIKWGTF